MALPTRYARLGAKLPVTVVNIPQVNRLKDSSTSLAPQELYKMTRGYQVIVTETVADAARRLNENQKQQRKSKLEKNTSTQVGHRSNQRAVTVAKRQFQKSNTVIKTSKKSSSTKNQAVFDVLTTGLEADADSRNVVQSGRSIMRIKNQVRSVREGRKVSSATREFRKTARRINQAKTGSKAASLLMPASTVLPNSLRAYILKALTPLLVTAVAFVMVTQLLIVPLAGVLVMSEKRTENLNPVAAYVANYLMNQGLDELHTAAVLGNLYAESSYSTTIVNSIGASGLAQWLNSRKTRLDDYAASKGVDWTDLQTQCEYLWAEMTGTGPASAYASVQYDHQVFLSKSTVREATEFFCLSFERPATWEYEASIVKRTDEAENTYFQLSLKTAGYGQEYSQASTKQQMVVAQAYIEPSPGAGLCAAWVTYVFAHTGLVRAVGNANDMFDNYCGYTDQRDLKVGMIVATPKTKYGAGQTYGHVGIYVGNGLVRSNLSGEVSDMTLDQFQQLSDGYRLAWGWFGWLDLSGR